jgi:hypothetical protein
MRRVFGVTIVLLLALVCLPADSFAQTGGAGGRDRGFQLDANFPNPFNPETKIPFTLGEILFEEGKPVNVTLVIYNTLMQRVAIPVALDTDQGNAARLENLEYTTPGRKEAHWDGLDRNGNQVASGIYLYQLIVNGVLSPLQRMFVAK